MAESEGVALNQLINVAVAEKLSGAANGRLFSRTIQPCRHREGEANTEASRPGKSGFVENKPRQGR